MKPRRELLLELGKDGYRRQLYRTAAANGRDAFIEMSDLPDMASPVGDDAGYAVHFSLRAAWSAVLRYTSPEGLMSLRAWHQAGSEWVSMVPVFIHPDLRPLVQRSLADLTREASLNRAVTENIGHWLRVLTTDKVVRTIEVVEPHMHYRHAS